MAAHDEAAARSFPGLDFYTVLGWIHQALRPRTYVEIGVLNGDSLRLVQPGTMPSSQQCLLPVFHTQRFVPYDPRPVF